MTEEAKAQAWKIEMTQQLVAGQVNVAMQIPLEDIVELVNYFEHYDIVMPIVDPTRYRDHMESQQAGREIARAYLDFRQALDKIKQRHQPKST